MLLRCNTNGSKQEVRPQEVIERLWFGVREKSVLLKILRGDIDGVGEVINARVNRDDKLKLFLFLRFPSYELPLLLQPAGPTGGCEREEGAVGVVWFEFRIRE